MSLLNKEISNGQMNGGFETPKGFRRVAFDKELRLLPVRREVYSGKVERRCTYQVPLSEGDYLVEGRWINDRLGNTSIKINVSEVREGEIVSLKGLEAVNIWNIICAKYDWLVEYMNLPAIKAPSKIHFTGMTQLNFQKSERLKSWSFIHEGILDEHIGSLMKSPKEGIRLKQRALTVYDIALQGATIYMFTEDAPSAVSFEAEKDIPLREYVMRTPSVYLVVVITTDAYDSIKDGKPYKFGVKVDTFNISGE